MSKDGKKMRRVRDQSREISKESRSTAPLLEFLFLLNSPNLTSDKEKLTYSKSKLTVDQLHKKLIGLLANLKVKSQLEKSSMTMK